MNSGDGRSDGGGKEETSFIYSAVTLSTISHTNIKLKNKTTILNTSLSLLSLLEGESESLLASVKEATAAQEGRAGEGKGA